MEEVEGGNPSGEPDGAVWLLLLLFDVDEDLWSDDETSSLSSETSKPKSFKRVAVGLLW